MKTIAILILAAASLAAQDFKGTISGLGAPEPAPYVPDPTLGFAGGLQATTVINPQGIAVVVFSEVIGVPDVVPVAVGVPVPAYRSIHRAAPTVARKAKR